MRPLAPDDWSKIIHPGCRVFLAGGAAVPFALVDSFLAQAAQFKDVEIVHIYGLGPSPWIAPEYNESLRTNSFFLTQSLQEAVERGQADYTPCPLSEVASLFHNGPLPLDVALIQVSPPDASGNCSLGVAVDVVRSAINSARTIVAQINPHMPRTCGDTLLPLRKIHFYLESSAALPQAPKPVTDARHTRIGRYAAQLIEDGATIQLGLGNTPAAVAQALRKHRHLGIHSGLFNDALMDLVKCGAADGSKKSFRPGKIIASHVIGSRKLYDFVDGNETLELHPSDWVYNPARIARNDRMVSINGAREVDLTGQVVRDSKGHRFYGGLGALQDFVRGAGHSKHGRPIIVLTSTSDLDGSSRIVAGLESGSGVSTGRADVHYVVTEFGVASIHGRSIRERVARLVEVAHPDHRESLLAGARKRGWLPAFFTMPPTDPKTSPDGVESSWVLFNKKRFFLRPLYPSDMRALQEFFYSHDEETVRLRYGYQRNRMTGESAYKLSAVDQQKDLAFGLFEEARGRQELRAIARYYLEEEPTTAEVAFVVHENFRKLGMAGFLIGKLAETAKKRGITHFVASVLPENHAMRNLFLAVGGKKSSRNGDENYFSIPLAGILRTRAAYLKRKRISFVR